ncbi:MAG: glycosyltransferase [Pseudomonadota bacterium]
MPHKKLLHIFQSFEMGGAQNRFLQFMRHAAHPEHDHYILALNGNYSLLEHWPKTVRRPILYDEFHYKKGYILRNIFAFWQLFRKKSFDLILTQNWPTIEAVIANTPQKIPHIHSEDGFGADEANGLKSRRNLVRKIFLMGKTLLVPSLTLKKIADDYWRGPDCDLYYIMNGVEDHKDDEPPCPFDFRDKIIFTTVAILRPEKNLSLFMTVLADLVHDHGLSLIWVIIGDGPCLNDLKAQAKRLNLIEGEHILFTGFQKNYKPYLKHSDIFVLSSLTEQQPLSVLEAMSYLKPVIATDVGDIATMVAPENRDLIAHSVFQAPYTSLKALIKEPKYRQSLGLANKNWQMTYFDLEHSLKMRAKLIEERMSYT